MTKPNLPARQDIDRELIKLIAMDIGKAVVSHIRTMRPEAYAALGPSGAILVRNCTYNEIMAALSTTDADEIKARLKKRASWRRQHHAIYDKIRSKKDQSS